MGPAYPNTQIPNQKSLPSFFLRMLVIEEDDIKDLQKCGFPGVENLCSQPIKNKTGRNSIKTVPKCAASPAKAHHGKAELKLKLRLLSFMSPPTTLAFLILSNQLPKMLVQKNLVKEYNHSNSSLLVDKIKQ